MPEAKHVEVLANRHWSNTNAVFCSCTCLMPGQVVGVNARLNRINKTNGYVQITLNGFPRYCHVCDLSNMPRFVFDHTCVDFCQQWPRTWEVGCIAKIVRMCWSLDQLTRVRSVTLKRVDFKLHDYSIGVSLQTWSWAGRKCYSLRIYG